MSSFLSILVVEIKDVRVNDLGSIHAGGRVMQPQGMNIKFPKTMCVCVGYSKKMVNIYKEDFECIEKTVLW